MKTFLVFCLMVSGLLSSGLSATTALDDYVKDDDGHYGWRIVNVFNREEGSVYVILLNSQAWGTGKEVDRILWSHLLMVYVPRDIKYNAAFLQISGGCHPLKQPNGINSFFANLAVTTHAVTAQLFNVPNQSLRFLGDKRLQKRVEDEVIAYSWAQNIQTGDSKWLVNLPMTKSVIKAMDTITELCQNSGVSRTVDQFVVSGYSKRGWTTWLSAIVDKRVIGIVPIVFDALNMKISLKHHKQVYGKYAKALTPYVKTTVMEAMEKGKCKKSLSIIDPISYLKRLTIPKLIINSTGDQFFLPDSWKFYYDSLPQPKWLLYIPNTDHGMDNRANLMAAAFFRALLHKKAFPTYSWNITSLGKMTVSCKQKPHCARVWLATNPAARNFQKRIIGAAWKHKELSSPSANKNGYQYQVKIDAPKKGWTAYMVELIFNDPVEKNKHISVTTGVDVISMQSAK